MAAPPPPRTRAGPTPPPRRPAANAAAAKHRGRMTDRLYQPAPTAELSPSAPRLRAAPDATSFGWRGGAMTARIFNGLMGVWLVVSAFAWPHSRAMTNYTVVCGVLTA